MGSRDGLFLNPERRISMVDFLETPARLDSETEIDDPFADWVLGEGELDDQSASCFDERDEVPSRSGWGEADESYYNGLPSLRAWYETLRTACIAPPVRESWDQDDFAFGDDLEDLRSTRAARKIARDAHGHNVRRSPCQPERSWKNRRRWAGRLLEVRPRWHSQWEPRVEARLRARSELRGRTTRENRLRSLDWIVEQLDALQERAWDAWERAT